MFVSGRSVITKTFIILLSLLGLAGCDQIPTLEIDPVSQPIETDKPAGDFTILVDGETLTIASAGSTIREVLADAGVDTSLNDEITPPLYEPAVSGQSISIIRITESIETIERSVPFERRTVRNESMSADAPPTVIQQGQVGLEELTVRIIFRDGIETDRQITRVVMVQEPQEEILMVGADIVSQSQELSFTGTLAFINGSGAQILNGESSFPQTIDLGGTPDRRVFSLSPDGSYLLYTLSETTDDQFNSLWVIETEVGADPVNLGGENILWADWNPSRRERNEIAWSTGEATTLSPGWEANNDLWLVEIDDTEVITDSIEQILQPFPVTYGWWGGDYAWSPDGRLIGYSFANEIGVIQPQRNGATADSDLQRRQTLHQFTEYDTQSDWVWIPPLSWSPDSTLLAFTRHGGEETTADQFETWILHVPIAQSGQDGAVQLTSESGIWSYPFWATEVSQDRSIAYLIAGNAQNTLASGYTLWLADEDGSNSRQIFPAEGVAGNFSRERRSIAWSTSEPHKLTFVYDGDLFLYDGLSNTVLQLTESDGQVSHPTWAPYGAGQ